MVSIAVQLSHAACICRPFINVFMYFASVITPPSLSYSFFHNVSSKFKAFIEAFTLTGISWFC